MTGRYLIEGPWIVFAVYWAIGAFKTRRTAKKESFAARYGIMAFEIIGFVLIFDDDAGIGILGHRVFHHSPAIAITGVVLLWAGIALALWARWHLGQIGVGASRSRKITNSSAPGPMRAFDIPSIQDWNSRLSVPRWPSTGGDVLLGSA